MEQEAGDERVWRQRHGLLLVARWASIIFVGKRDARISDSDQAFVGDSNAVRIARQIGQHRVWSRERSFGINHPLLGAHGRDKAGKGLGVSQVGVITKEAQLPVTMQGHELVQEQPPK